MLLHHCFKTIVNTIHVHQIQIAVVTDTSKFKISLSLESAKHYFNKRGKKSICAVEAMKEL